jgi:hypothetical protein
VGALRLAVAKLEVETPIDRQSFVGAALVHNPIFFP